MWIGKRESGKLRTFVLQTVADYQAIAPFAIIQVAFAL
jgi:hypothetical protein